VKRELKNRMKALFKRLGYILVPTFLYKELIDFIQDRAVDVVIDVGANFGQFAESLRAKGYRGRIISFEPVEASFQILSTKAAGDDKWQVYQCGLGATPGEAIINVSAASDFSSILKTSNAAKEFNELSAVARTETIQIKTLDDVAAGLTGNILVKIDTQGYERYVIEGGKATLRRVKGVFMELPLIHLYEGNWKFHEAVKYMDDLGFVPAQIHPTNYHSKDNSSLVEVDCLFRPHELRQSA
jgi:FkbM family methyltransferase